MNMMMNQQTSEYSLMNLFFIFFRLREIGFTIVYGTLILRIYKMLAEFQSRKAHCVQVKEKDILRILFFISISIIGYLLGWTFVNIDHANENLELNEYLLGHGFTFRNKRYFQACRSRSWDYLVQIGLLMKLQ